MPLDDAIRAAAEQNGVQQQFWDNFGHPHVTDPETNAAILTAIGFNCSSEETLGRPQASGHETPPVLVLLEGESVPIAGEIELENGGTLASNAAIPLGYHTLRTTDKTIRLIVAPPSARRMETRRAGLGVTLYGVRSARNWGAGDFRDLRDLIDWAVPALAADFIALNPIHAIHNRTPYNASPYLPNSIFYRNFLYLDVEAVPGYESVRAQFETPETLAEMDRLRATEIVQYEAVAALLTFDRHRFPADNHVLGDGEDPLGEERAQCSVKPQADVGAAARVFKLLDAEPDFAERDFRGEQLLAGLSGDELGHGRRRFRFTQLGNDVGVEEPTPHRLTSRTGDLMVNRSKFTSVSGEAANAVTMSRPEIGRCMRSNSSARTTTTASRPCSVTRCGPRCRACRTTSLSRALAS